MTNLLTHSGGLPLSFHSHQRESYHLPGLQCRHLIKISFPHNSEEHRDLEKKGIWFCFSKQKRQRITTDIPIQREWLLAPYRMPANDGKSLIGAGGNSGRAMNWVSGASWLAPSSTVNSYSSLRSISPIAPKVVMSLWLDKVLSYFL